MALYEFYCKLCDHYLEKEGQMSKPPKRMKCPVCKKQAHRAINSPNFKIAGKVTKWDKSDAKRMYNEMIDDSKQRLKTQPSPYSRWDFDPKFAEVNGARKLSDKELSKKIEVATEQTKRTLEVKKRAKV